MSLLTELEILFDWFLQRCHADGAGNGARVCDPQQLLKLDSFGI